MQSKRELIRLVRTETGVGVDLTGKANGRGVYLHNLRSCWERGLKGALASALKTEINAEDMAKLKSIMETLPDDTLEESNSLPGKE
ncbi:MAG: YlxR family protein [Anaerolineae bacterium]|nr:YlxR family protein [Anaerolineae bacterium]